MQATIFFGDQVSQFKSCYQLKFLIFFSNILLAQMLLKVWGYIKMMLQMNLVLHSRSMKCDYSRGLLVFRAFMFTRILYSCSKVTARTSLFANYKLHKRFVSLSRPMSLTQETD
jgi:hypothetical protein